MRDQRFTALPLVAELAPRPQRLESVVVWFPAAAMAVSLLVAATAGLTFGVLAALSTGTARERWAATTQAHGELQLWAWFAVFIAALAFEFMVRFSGQPPVPLLPRLVGLSLIGVGAILSSTGRLLDMAWLVTTGAASTAVGTLVVAVLVARIRAVQVDVYPLFFRAGAVWLLLASLAGLAASRTVVAGATSFEESHLVAELFLRGFVMNVTFAVALRAFVGHLGLPPMPVGQQRVLWGLVNLSIIVWAAGSPGFGLPGSLILTAAGDLLFAGALLWATLALSIARAVRAWRHNPERAQVLVPLAWIGLPVYALTLAVQALAKLTGGVVVTFYEAGAVRHMLALGFVAPLLIAMAHVVLERFLIGRLSGARWLTTAFVLLLVAWPLRTLPPLLDAGMGDASRALMAVAGVLTGGALLIAAAVATHNAVEADRYARVLRRAEAKRSGRTSIPLASSPRESPRPSRRTDMQEIDVRDDIVAGREPFPRIMAAVGGLGPGEGVRLIAPFEPVPLYAVLDQRGLLHQAEAQGDGVWHVTIRRTASDVG